MPEESAQLISIYQCFCEETRLRILSLLFHGPLCVCHFQDLLGKTQVHISKHLGYLREKGLVVARRHANWMVYALPEVRSAELDANLKCLQDCVQTHAVFKADLKRLLELKSELNWLAALPASKQQDNCCR